MSFLQSRAARAAQSQVAVENQIEEVIDISRAAKIERLQRVSIPGEEKREVEERDLAAAAEEDLAQLEREKQESDGSEETLESFARRRRPIEFRIGQATKAAAHHKRAIENLRAELAALQAAEDHDRAAAELAALEARAAELVSQRVAIYRAYIAVLTEYDAIEAAVISEKFVPFGRGEAQARLRAARERAALAIGNDRSLSKRPEIRF